MEPARLHKSGTSSLADDATRNSVQSRFQRSVSWGSTAPSTRTSTETDYSGYQYTYDTTYRPQIPSRAASWNGQQNGAYAPHPGPWMPPAAYTPMRPHTLMKPQRLAGSRRFSLSNTPGDAFSKLPREIMIVILVELRKLHLEVKDETQTCTTCFMRDVCSLALTCRNWMPAAQLKLYTKIWLVGPDSTRRFKKKSSSRLKLLRRTLETNETLAGYVKDLKVPDMDEATTRGDCDKYFEMVASIIMACPNFERLIGHYPVYNHESSQLILALSTRKRLVEHVWNIHPGLRQKRPPSMDSVHSHSGRNALSPEQNASFLSHHYKWQNLATLVIHCKPGGVMEPQLLSRTFNYLPLSSLAHLTLSALPKIPADLFESLPPLQSLNLSNLKSLTSQNLSSLTTSPSAQTITCLRLIHVNVASLPVLARLLAKLSALTRLTLQQDNSPTFPIGPSIFLHPYLASSTLTHLTWDILFPNSKSPHQDATYVLSEAIRASGFPSLRVLKSPTDHDGTIQSLCKPVERLLPDVASVIWKGSATGTLVDKIDSKRKDSAISGMDDGASFASYGTTYSRSLQVARQAAQARIEAAKVKHKFHIIAEDWTEGKDAVRVTARFEVAGYIGTVGSKIHYSLEPDVEGKDEVGVCVDDLLACKDGGNGSQKLVCDGKWNSDPIGGKAKRKVGWQHKERVKWRPMEVGMLF